MTRQVILAPLTEFLQRPWREITVAYSGGVDSTVLLHALAQLQANYSFKLKALHIQHGLQPEAERWLTHCAEICRQWQIPFLAERLKQSPGPGESVEAWARQQRLALFERALIGSDSVLVTAQHQQDQAETLLLQLLRGSGGRGLAAMPALKSLGSGFLARPLLGCSRQQILSYASEHGLRWVEDPSNRNTDFDRNYLRQVIWPQLLQRWPGAASNLARSASHLAAQNRVLDQYCQQLFPEAGDLQQRRLSLDYLAKLNNDQRMALLRYWIYACGFRPPSTRRLQAGLGMLLGANPSANPSLRWGDISIQRYRRQLYLLRHLATEPLHATALSPNAEFRVAGLASFRIEPGFPGFAWPAQGALQLRFRHGGEKLQLQPGGCHHSLKKLLQAWGIAPWQRARLPLLYHQDKLVAVADQAIQAEFQAGSAENSYRLVAVSIEQPYVLN